MKNETDVFCKKRRNGSQCRGALMRDQHISRLEQSLGHRKYTCDKCGTSFKFGTEDYGLTVMHQKNIGLSPQLVR